ncbi:TetR/AcrR family transcriptional regulator [Pontixanthobacter aquaemixtae]|uniref:TetR family transcriptional regulator n=1 Tax=Pontixanthobacter aquaemixtae TaxID=1958940 RepID=A0A844ZSW8_9SPHN|nr:TetR/AcrR family transcriptional regulator [Pontixanthobacter aquaemixtae]MXO89897.1 TetR family transcriptional regulator [Pontixanthobacter aquaemixtae]
MARPISVTDEAILLAADEVMAEQGILDFSVSEVSRRVGLSRAAVTLRFDSPAALKCAVYDRATKRMAGYIASWDITPGGEGLLEIAGQIGRLVGGKSKLGMFMMRLSENIEDPAAREMELERGRLVRDAVAKAMPETSVNRDDAVNAFMAQVTGSLIAWRSSTESDAEAFLVSRIKVWLALTGICVAEGAEGA